MGLEEVQAGGGGLGGVVARCGLQALAGAWWCGWSLKRVLYGARLAPVRRLSVPVISVGNLAVGGTGKTPFTSWLARGLLERGYRPGILSRGYGPPAAGETGLSDEGCVLRHDLGSAVPQVERPQRFEGGRRLLADWPETNVVLLDDGFQHWGLARDLDVVLLDATRPFGYSHLLPRGRLREPPSALRRADLVVLTRTEHRTEEQLGDLRGDVAARTSAPVVPLRTVPRGLATSDEVEGPESLAGRRVFAACGIGNPASFLALLASLGAEVVGHRALRDHAALDAAQVEGFRSAARDAGAELVVLTRKDAVKLDRLPPGVAVLDIQVEPTNGEDQVWALVEGVLKKP